MRVRGKVCTLWAFPCPQLNLPKRFFFPDAGTASPFSYTYLLNLFFLIVGGGGCCCTNMQLYPGDVKDGQIEKVKDSSTSSMGNTPSLHMRHSGSSRPGQRPMKNHGNVLEWCLTKPEDPIVWIPPHPTEGV